MIHRHIYKNIDVTRDLISLILVLSEMSLSFQMVESLVRAAVPWAILLTTYFFGPSSDIVAPRYLNDFTTSSLLPLTKISDDRPSFLFVTIFVFSALISMPAAFYFSSRFFTWFLSSSSEPASPSMSSAKRRFVIVLPPALIEPTWVSSASSMILSKKMLKRVGESKHPCLTPTVVLNHSPMLLFRYTALLALSYRLLMVWLCHYRSDN